MRQLGAQADPQDRELLKPGARNQVHEELSLYLEPKEVAEVGGGKPSGGGKVGGAEGLDYYAMPVTCDCSH